MTRVPGTGPRVVSASRRTDVPAFHARWLLGRLRAGYCHWVHPYTARVGRVSLAPADVLAIVFWTRHPGPLVPHLEALRAEGFAMLFQFTITGYPPPIESHNPPLDGQIAAAEEIARRLGPESVLWRYDPILLAEDLTPSVHVERFAHLAARLEGITRRCTFSFVDFYGKTTRNLTRVEEMRGRRFGRPGADERIALAARLAPVATEHGMALVSCCDDALVGEGVGKARCVDPGAIGAVRGETPAPLPLRPTRRDCACAASVDIGVYDTCAFGCSYCYAVSSRGTALRRLRECDPDDSVLWRPPSLRGRDLDALADLDGAGPGAAPPAAGPPSPPTRPEPPPDASPLEGAAVRS